MIVAVAAAGRATGPRAKGLYNGKSRSTNIIAASIEAYLEALNAMLAEEHWAGAAESAGKGAAHQPEPTAGAASSTKDGRRLAPWVDS